MAGFEAAMQRVRRLRFTNDSMLMGRRILLRLVLCTLPWRSLSRVSRREDERAEMRIGAHAAQLQVSYHRIQDAVDDACFEMSHAQAKRIASLSL